MNTNLIDNIELIYDTSDYPDFCDAYIVSADYNGQPMTETELDEINQDSEFVHNAVFDNIF